MDERGRRKNKNNGREWDGANAFSNSGFSVWCKLISHSHYEKAFSGSHCLSAASWHSSGSLTSSTFVVLLVTVLTKKKQKGKGCFRNCNNKTATKITYSLNTSFIPSDNSHLSNPEVCCTEFVHIPSLECWRKEHDNHRSHLETQRHKLEFMHEKLCYQIHKCVIKEN